MLRKRCQCNRDQWSKCDHLYFATFKVRGERKEFATGTADRDEAVVEAARLRKRERDATDPAGGSRYPLSKLAAAHIAERSRDRTVSKQRVKTIEWHWTPLLAYVGPDFDPRGITFERLEEYRDHRLQSVRGQTVEREFWCLHQGLRIAKRRGWIRDYLPREDWPVIGHDAKDQARAGKLHSLEVIQAVLAECDQDLRDRIELGAMTALRKAELHRLRFDWVRAAPAGLGCAALLYVPAESAKDRDSRVVPLGQPAVDILRRRFEELGDGLVFHGDRKKALYVAVKAARDAATERLGEPEARRQGYYATLTLRDLRHAYLTTGERITLDRKAAADAAGHARLSTTEIYLHSDLPRLVAFANAAGSWLGGVEGGGRKDASAPLLSAPESLLFSGGLLVGTTGFEPVTPTVSSEGQAPKSAKSLETGRNRGHVKSRTYARGGRKVGGGG